MQLVQLGPQCNNSCLFCAQANERPNCANLDIAQLRRHLEETNIADQSVAIVGGEPTIHSELPELIRSVRELDAREVILQTNARRLAYQSYVATLVECGVSCFEVSLHGSTAAMHDYHTRTPGSFQQTLRGIVNAIGANRPVVVSTVLTRSNYRHMAEMVRLADRIKVQRLVVRQARPIGSALEFRARVLPSLELAIPYFREAKRTATALGLRLEIEGPNLPTVLHRDYVPFFANPANQHENPTRDELSLETGRPKPASNEDRSSERQTGIALRELFPDLFESGKSEG